MSQYVESLNITTYEEQRVSPAVLLAIWLLLGIATYGYAMFQVWAPQLSSSLLIIT